MQYNYNEEKKAKAYIYILFVKILEIFFKVYKKKRNIFPNKIEKILIIKPDHIGDTIISTICLKPLKENYPNSKIDVLCGSWGKKTYEYQSKINNIYVLDHFLLNRKNINFIKKFLIFLYDYYNKIIVLRKKKYDLCIYLRGALKANLITLTAYIKPKYTIGYTGMGCENLLDEKIEYSQFIPERDNFLNLLKKIPEFKLKNKKYMYELKLGTNKLIWKKIKIEKNKINVFFNTDGNEKNRKLSIEKIIEILKKLEFLENINIYIVYLPNNEMKIKKLNEEILKNNLKKTKILYKTDNFFELGNIIKKMNLVITVDTAITHLASIFIKQIIVIYEKNPRKYPRFTSNCEKEYSIISKDNNISNINVNEIIESINSLNFKNKQKENRYLY